MKKIITVTIDNNLDEEFREIIMLTYGKRKGSYSKALEEAIKEWIAKRKRELLIKEVLDILEKGLKGRKWRFNRKEIYER